MNLLRAAAGAAHFLEARKIPYFIIGGLALRLIGPEDLIIHKCVAGRPRDLEDVEGILIRQRVNLDLGTVREWLENFRPVVDTHDPLELFDQALRRARRALEGPGGDEL